MMVSQHNIGTATAFAQAIDRKSQALKMLVVTDHADGSLTIRQED